MLFIVFFEEIKCGFVNASFKIKFLNFVQFRAVAEKGVSI